MLHKANKLFIAVLVLMISSCGDAKDNNVKTTSTTQAETEMNECLLAYQIKYDELLTVDEILAIAKLTKENIKIDYKRTSRYYDSHEYKLLFNNQRKA